MKPSVQTWLILEAVAGVEQKGEERWERMMLAVEQLTGKMETMEIEQKVEEDRALMAHTWRKTREPLRGCDWSCRRRTWKVTKQTLSERSVLLYGMIGVEEWSMEEIVGSSGVEEERVGQAHFRSGHSPNFRAVIQEYGFIDV